MATLKYRNGSTWEELPLGKPFEPLYVRFNPVNKTAIGYNWTTLVLDNYINDYPEILELKSDNKFIDIKQDIWIKMLGWVPLNSNDMGTTGTTGQFQAFFVQIQYTYDNVSSNFQIGACHGSSYWGDVPFTKNPWMFMKAGTSLCVQARNASNSSTSKGHVDSTNSNAGLIGINVLLP